MSSKPSVIGAAVLSIGLIVWAAIYNHRGGTSGYTGRHTAGAGLAAGHAAGRAAAPDFSLPKLGGGTITLSEFRGQKPVVVDFWASWCPNCRRDMPNLNRYYEKYKDKVEVIGVNLQGDSDTVYNFIASRGISFPTALDPYGQAAQAFGIQYTNTHFLIDREGRLVRAIPGDIKESDIQSLIQ